MNNSVNPENKQPQKQITSLVKIKGEAHSEPENINIDQFHVIESQKVKLQHENIKLKGAFRTLKQHIKKLNEK